MNILSTEVSNTIARTTVLEVKPSGGDISFHVTVTLPDGEVPPGGLNAILALDGNYSTGVQVQAAYFLSLEMSMAPSVIVGIGYPLNHPILPRFARNQHLTPGTWPDWDRTYSELLGCEAPPPSGQADEFLSFISEDLMPHLEEQFDVNASEWSIIGHSLGGLFSTFALLSDPHRFRRYLICGASYWWKPFNVMQKLEEFIADTEPLEVSVYIAAGDLESRSEMEKQFAQMLSIPTGKAYFDVMGGVPDITGDSQKVAEMLSKRAGLCVRYEELENETHGSAIFTATSQGLRWLHATS